MSGLATASIVIIFTISFLLICYFSFVRGVVVPAKKKLADGTIEYRVYNDLHQDKDLPAVIKPNGTVKYYRYNRLGRGNRGENPAVIFPNGDCVHYWFDHIHNESGPAVNFGNVTLYCEIDLLHRVDGPAYISPELEAHYRYGYLDNNDGPAVVHASGKIEHFTLGLRHNDQGPAVSGPGIEDEFYIFGRKIDKEHFENYYLKATDSVSINEQIAAINHLSEKVVSNPELAFYLPNYHAIELLEKVNSLCRA